MTPKAFHALFGRIGARAKMQFPIHPHMLRHGCGYALANAGHDTRALQAWLGHKNIQHTVRYIELAPDRFRNFWRSRRDGRLAGCGEALAAELDAAALISLAAAAWPLAARAAGGDAGDRVRQDHDA